MEGKGIKQLDGILNLFFPRRCPVCDDVVKPSDGLACRQCVPQLRYITGSVCMKCGKTLRSAHAEYCYDCSSRHHVYDRGMALYDYHSIADSIYRFKYKGRQEYAQFYGEEICRHLGADVTRLKPDVLLPVPIHRKRRQERGYNQAAVLAHAISRGLHIPVEEKLMIRQRRTTPQKELSGPERQNNLKKAFKILRNDVKLNTIIIVDDIYTTGSTIDAMAKELRGSGVNRIYFITLAIGQGV